MALTAPLAACPPATCRDSESSRCYGPVQDAAAMAAIESAWSEAGGLSLSLCEDVGKAGASAADGCAI
jgi:hypothetical protein